MTRPRVDPAKRRRTAQACESCKRRKQKCNGLDPCNTCTRRSLACTYGTEGSVSDSPTSEKRQKADHTSSSVSTPTGSSHRETKEPEHAPDPEFAPYESQQQVPANHQPKSFERPQKIDIPGLTREPVKPVPPFDNGRREASEVHLKAPDLINVASSPGYVASERSDEEAVLFISTRMLQDQTGRLLYVGDAATLSFLQLIRMIVESIAGPSPFTQDPQKHRIVEAMSSLPANFRQTRLLPDRETAQVLVEAYFTNTIALVEIFPRTWFMSSLESCYADPLSVDPSWLCLLYLTFAIGLVMASPVPGCREFAIIQKLRAGPLDRAEVFYQDAKNLGDPSTGFEDAGFWSVQALTLMSLYTLMVSKRNAAYAYHGMAIRSAIALGLHREEALCIFSSAEQAVRRNLWRSLFVLDRFLSSSLGRPTAIRESDCSGTTLATRENPPFPQAPFPTAANADFTNSVGLAASVQSCHAIGVILDKVYSQRKISTGVAQEIADLCKRWPITLDASLNWRQTNQVHPSQGIAILHVNLMYCHSIILLTRPFFLFLMNKRFKEQKDGQHTQKPAKMVRFAEACVIASSQSVALVQSAAMFKYLPQRNPFVLYFLFSSTLVVLSNEFASLYNNPLATTTINNAITIMEYCAQRDPQASRLVFILTSYREVVIRRQSSTSFHPIANSNFLSYGVDDPVGNFFSQTNLGPPSIPNHPFLMASPPSLLPQTLQSPGHSHLTRGSSSASSSNPTFTHPNNLVENSPEDALLGLTGMPSHQTVGGETSLDGGESQNSANDAEIDFEMLWQWPNSSVPVPTSGMPAINFTSGGSIGLVGEGSGHNRVGASYADIQGLSNSSIPLYGMSNGGGGS